jgi:hypothetical protein
MVAFYASPGFAVVAIETIASLVAAIGLTAANIPPTNNQTLMAVVQAVGGDVRFTMDGSTAPVAATTGHRLLQDGVIELWGESMNKFRAIDDGGTAKLEVSYYGRGS